MLETNWKNVSITFESLLENCRATLIIRQYGNFWTVTLTIPNWAGNALDAAVSYYVKNTKLAECFKQVSLLSDQNICDSDSVSCDGEKITETTVKSQEKSQEKSSEKSSDAFCINTGQKSYPVKSFDDVLKKFSPFL